MYKIIQKSKYWTSVTTLLVVASVVAWFMWGLNLGIDFTGGTSMQLHFSGATRPALQEIQDAMNTLGIQDVRAQFAGEEDVVLKLQHIDNDQRQRILDAFAEKEVTEVSFSSIGPTLGSELKKKSVVALGLVLLAIILYISYVFRVVSKGPVPSWIFGFGAVVALVHDVIIVLGVFIVLGHFWNVQIDSLFVTALLTVLGFSVHDTIVVYDRIREGLKDKGKYPFTEIVNNSINTTMARSLNTSMTTLIVLLALFIFGGESIHYFVLALIVGIIVGTYSSIFIASPVLLLGERFFKKRLR